MCTENNNYDYLGNFYNWWNNNNDQWTHFTTNWNSTGTTTSWICCPNCNNLVEWGNKYCGCCGYQMIADEPENKDILDKLDELIKEIIDLKAKLINNE